MPKPVERKLEIWTDGACKGNPGPGGWGALLAYGAARKGLYGGDRLTTNNKMEIAAVVAALLSLKRPMEVTIHTDSQYVRNGIERWIASWRSRGWRKAGGRPVKNVGYWKALSEAASRHRISWHWVKGHAGNEGNEEADRLANLGVAVARGEEPACPHLAPAVLEVLARMKAEDWDPPPDGFD